MVEHVCEGVCVCVWEGEDQGHLSSKFPPYLVQGFCWVKVCVQCVYVGLGCCQVLALPLSTELHVALHLSFSGSHF